MNDSVVIRDATPADADRIAEIHVRSWQAAYRGQLPSSFLDALSETLERRRAWWREQIAGPASPHQGTLVEEADGAVVGFAGIGPSRDADAGPGRGEVYTIYLAPEQWGRGIGRALFEEAVERLGSLGFRTASLWVLEPNERARRFYEAAGWRHDGATRTDRRGDVELREVRYVTAVSL